MNLSAAPKLRDLPQYAGGQRRWFLIGMLGLLHLALAAGLQDAWSRPLLLVHMGLFLLWQPLWRSELRLTPGAITFIGLVSVVVLFGLSWWLLALWLGLLFGVVGGRVFGSQAVWLRLFYLGVMVYLLVLLLVWVVPQLVGAPGGTQAAREAMNYLLPALLVCMALMPLEREPSGGGQVVDLLYSLVLFMVAMVMVLGVFAVMTISRQDYLLALIQTLFIMGALLLLAGWLWNPRFGFAGLQQLFSTYLLNVGTPFEHWLTRIARAAELEREPGGFLAFAAEELGGLPWVRGVAWQSPDGEGRRGQEGTEAVRLEMGEVSFHISTRYATSPAMAVHMRLLVQLIWRFYEAKRREKAMRDMARMQAIHETGARLTHDVKNLLQSLYGLATAAEHASADQAYQQLLRRQLPNFTRRLEATLSKLRSPQQDAAAEGAPLGRWWGAMRDRYERQDAEFEAAIEADREIPLGLFDSVLENLLDNTRHKRIAEPGIRVVARCAADGEGVTLTVTDSGSPVPERVARTLLQGTVESESGLGIGLYQCARWAEREGYRLRLRENRPGSVCFELAGPVSGEPAGGDHPVE
jgi:signal transduction histidine kinase